MGSYKIFKSIRNAQYFFNFDADNGRTIITSEYYPYKSSCLSGIQSVKHHCPYDSNYRRFQDSVGEYRFNLVASNGEIIARSSEGYNRREDRDHAIEILKRQGPGAGTIDFT